MNIQQNPQLALFLQQLSQGNSTLLCPICGKPVETLSSGESRISALCSSCDFHASVPNQSKA